MNKQSIVNNWEMYYKSYLKLNPDLVLSGINSKRALLNHFVKYGYDEGRPYNENEPLPSTNPTQILTLSESVQSNDLIQIKSTQIKINSKFYLEERMIIEKIDLNL